VTHAPASIEEASSVFRDLAAKGRTLGITGASAPGGPASGPVDEIVSTRLLNGIVDYVPADQIVTVEAGATIARLQATLRECKQRLALDPPAAEHTTVGGTVATASYGPLRTRYGTARDLIVGMTIVRADGTVAHGGGKVVKNVAGFDIPKLMAGTHGTLAMIGTVTFRLHPLPEAATQVVFPACDPAALRALVTTMTQAQLEPSAVYALYDGSAYACAIRFEGFPAGVAAQRATLLRLAQREHGEDATLESEHEAARTGGALKIKIAAAASMVEALHDEGIVPLHTALARARTVVYPSIATAFISGDCDDVASVLRALKAARAWAERAGGTLIVEEAPAAIRAAFDPWGSPPPSFALMRALKDRFDPSHRLNPGGFVGGL